MAGEGLVAFRRRYPVTRDIPVAWGDMDAFGHVNNTVYFRYFETARIALLEHMKFSDPSINEGVGPILASTDCRFRLPLTYPDTVTAAAWIQEVTEDAFIMGYAVFSHHHDRVAAEGSGRIVAFDYGSGRKARLGQELRRTLETLGRGD